MATKEVAMTYTQAAVERAMKVHEVLMQALNGRQPWIQVAEVLGVSARTVRRLRRRYELHGFTGLYDHRHHRPSPRAVPLAEVQRLLRLYRDRYGPRDGHPGFNVRHFYHIARREHGVTVSYSFVKKALQAAALVPTHRARGRHRRRRPPRPCFGELLPLDGSRHVWLALVPGLMLTLIAIGDDATKQLLYAQLVEDGEGEGTAVVMTALREVLETHGIPGALYTDRAGWAVYTPTSGSAPDRTKLTQVGRALARLGIEHILGFSPQARGRSERANGTLQGRVVNELRVAEIRPVAAANRYLRERFLPDYDATFTHPPADPASAFVPLGPADLDQILCHEEERVVARDNTVSRDGLHLQIDKQRGRRSCVGLRVLTRRHLDGRLSIWWGPRCLGHYDAMGRPLRKADKASRRGYQHGGPLRQRGATRLVGPRLPVHPRLRTEQPPNARGAPRSPGGRRRAELSAPERQVALP
jgi:transposase